MYYYPIVTEKRGVLEVYLKYASLLFFSCIILFLSCSEPEATGSQAYSVSLALIGKDTVFVDQFKKSYEAFLLRTPAKDNQDTRKTHLNRMINDYLLAQAALELQLDTCPDFQHYQKIKEQAAMRQYQFDAIRQDTDFDDQQIKIAFQRAQESRLVRHLFSRNQSQINQYYKQLTSGESNFHSLARKAFTDSTLKSNGGLLGWVSWGDTDLQFEEKLYDTQMGQISAPFQTKFGWHIIKVEQIHQNLLPTELDYQQFVEKNKTKLQRIYQEEQLARELAELLEQQSIKLNLPVLKFVAQILKEQYLQNYAELPLKMQKLSVEAVEKLQLQLSEVSSERLIEYKEGYWLVRDFLFQLPEIPVWFVMTDIEKAVALAFRNELLAQQGYQAGINRKAPVRHATQLSSYAGLARRMSAQLLPQIPAERRLNFIDEDVHLYRLQQWRKQKAFLIEKRKQNTDINIFFNNLAKIYSPPSSSLVKTEQE